jgi:protein-tyrosine phosphatase
MAYRVTCVCLGNICRSPMAEAVLRQRITEAGLSDQIVVDSAGTSQWHVGADADPRARAALAAAGYRLQHVGRQFDPEWFDDTDLIVAMDQSNYEDLVHLADTYGRSSDHVRLFRSFDPSAPAGAEVPDPYHGSTDGFANVLAMIERASDGLVAQWMAGSGADELRP